MLLPEYSITVTAMYLRQCLTNPDEFWSLFYTLEENMREIQSTKLHTHSPGLSDPGRSRKLHCLHLLSEHVHDKSHPKDCHQKSISDLLQPYLNISALIVVYGIYLYVCLYASVFVQGYMGSCVLGVSTYTSVEDNLSCPRMLSILFIWDKVSYWPRLAL